jgi:hypothetical protein
MTSQQSEDTMIRMFRILVAATAVALAPAALALPCAGFTDVDDTSPFCPNVEWIKNRGVTLGCTATTLYCPADAVSRLAMSAFMNRLGVALTPGALRVDTSPGAIDLDAAVVVCQTDPYAVIGYPRRAYLDLSFAAQAPADVDVAADLVATTDGGATWTALTAVGNAGWVPAGRWGTLSNLAQLDLAVGQTVRFGVRMGRVTGGADLSDSRCNLRVALPSRNGTTSPF